MMRWKSSDDACGIGFSMERSDHLVSSKYELIDMLDTSYMLFRACHANPRTFEVVNIAASIPSIRTVARFRPRGRSI